MTLLRQHKKKFPHFASILMWALCGGKLWHQNERKTQFRADMRQKRKKKVENFKTLFRSRRNFRVNFFEIFTVLSLSIAATNTHRARLSTATTCNKCFSALKCLPSRKYTAEKLWATNLALTERRNLVNYQKKKLIKMQIFQPYNLVKLTLTGSSEVFLLCLACFSRVSLKNFPSIHVDVSLFPTLLDTCRAIIVVFSTQLSSIFFSAANNKNISVAGGKFAC